MNPSIESIQSDIKKCASESRELMLRIIALKWGSLENSKQAAKLRGPREEGVTPASRRAELKKLRHPETGPERAQLWAEKREVKDKARHLLLAYAFLRGRPYAQQERKCKVGPSLTWISNILAGAGVETTSEVLQAWIDASTTKEASATASAAA